MTTNLPPLPSYSHLVTPARCTNTFQGGQRPANIVKLASSTMSLNGSETPLNKTHLFSPSTKIQSPSSDHLLKYDIRRLRASLERKEEQISWWMEKSKNDSEKFDALKVKLEQTNRQYDLTLQCVRSTLDGLTCINRSVNLVFIQEENKENQNEDYEDQIDENLNENIVLLLLTRLNETCLKLSKNVDRLIRTPLTLTSSSKSPHQVQRQQSNASSISKQSVDDLNASGLIPPNTVYDDLIEKLNEELDSLRNRLAEQNHRTENLEEQLDQCKSAHLTAKILFDTQEKKLQEQLLIKDKQIISIASNEHDVLRQLLDEKTNAFEQLTDEHMSLTAKYQSEYSRNLDCMIKTDALHDHIRLLSETLAVKEVNEEKLTTQQQQMKKLMTLLLPPPPVSMKKSNEKRTFGRKVKRHLRESFSSLINQKQSSSGQQN